MGGHKSQGARFSQCYLFAWFVHVVLVPGITICLSVEKSYDLGNDILKFLLRFFKKKKKSTKTVITSMLDSQNYTVRYMKFSR